MKQHFETMCFIMGILDRFQKPAAPTPAPVPPVKVGRSAEKLPAIEGAEATPKADLSQKLDANAHQILEKVQGIRQTAGAQSVRQVALSAGNDRSYETPAPTHTPKAPSVKPVRKGPKR